MTCFVQLIDATDRLVNETMCDDEAEAQAYFQRHVSEARRGWWENSVRARILCDGEALAEEEI